MTQDVMESWSYFFFFSVENNSARDEEELMDRECCVDTNPDYFAVLRIPLEKNLKER